jgi:hypothetical protein
LFDDIVDSIQMSIGNGAQLAIADDYGPPPYAPYRHEETQTINQYAPFHTTFPELVTVCDVGFTFPDGHSECYSSHIEVKNIPITIQSLVEVDTVTNITGGYDGTFSLELELSQAALDVFSATGDLPITYKVQSGGVSIDSATLSFDVGSNDVPEPGSLALLGMGLAGLGLSRRRKHDKPPYPLG